jgi:methionyl-tRNA formyltransferase
VQLTVALAAEEAAGVRALQLLHDRGHRVAGVFTQSGASQGIATVAGRAAALGITARRATELRDAATACWLRANNVELMLNVHSLHIIDETVLEVPRLGAYNLHPGPLPERAGLHVPSWALYEGATRHGVTLHRMTSEVDAGAIAFAERFELRERDTGLTVMMQCVERGMKLIERLLVTAEQDGTIPADPQDLARRRWYGAGPPNGGRLEWRSPGRRIVGFVRACDYRPFSSPWRFPRSRAGELEVAIMSASLSARNSTAPAGTVAEADHGAVLIAAGDGWVRVEQIEVDGRAIAPAEVLRPGSRLR